MTERQVEQAALHALIGVGMNRYLIALIRLGASHSLERHAEILTTTFEEVTNGLDADHPLRVGVRDYLRSNATDLLKKLAGI